MSSTVPDPLRSRQHLFALLAWGSFALGAIAVVFLSFGALFADRPPPPEEFLAELGLILIAFLIPTLLFSIVAERYRRRRARNRPGGSTLLGSFSLFEDSTIGH